MEIRGPGQSSPRSPPPLCSRFRPWPRNGREGAAAERGNSGEVGGGDASENAKTRYSEGPTAVRERKQLSPSLRDGERMEKVGGPRTISPARKVQNAADDRPAQLMPSLQDKGVSREQPDSGNLSAMADKEGALRTA